MIFEKTSLAGLVVVKPARLEDSRGFFARSFCEREFTAAGLPDRFVQCNVSYNVRRGILRGMHFQAGEGKLVRCTRGRVFDVAIDLRRDSPTFRKWHGLELSQDNHHAFYIPPGFAHGFQTLVDESEVFYQMTDFFQPERAGGVRWNDPAFGVRWPLPNPELSERDQGFAQFE
ncbi:MAG: dTDP-4-dehydrorhamnose 3,5-epimerase [Bacteriovoracia bacterium]